MTWYRADQVEPGWTLFPPGRPGFTVDLILVTQDATGMFWVTFIGGSTSYKAWPSERVTAEPGASQRKEVDGE